MQNRLINVATCEDQDPRNSIYNENGVRVMHSFYLAMLKLSPRGKTSVLKLARVKMINVYDRRQHLGIIGIPIR